MVATAAAAVVLVAAEGNLVVAAEFPFVCSSAIRSALPLDQCQTRITSSHTRTLESGLVRTPFSKRRKTEKIGSIALPVRVCRFFSFQTQLGVLSHLGRSKSESQSFTGRLQTWSRPPLSMCWSTNSFSCFRPESFFPRLQQISVYVLWVRANEWMKKRAQCFLY